ncbi:MAG: hypothetical protein SGPRY_013934, partial [Prymnesium sp.]
ISILDPWLRIKQGDTAHKFERVSRFFSDAHSDIDRTKTISYLLSESASTQKHLDMNGPSTKKLLKQTSQKRKKKKKKKKKAKAPKT